MTDSIIKIISMKFCIPEDKKEYMKWKPVSYLRKADSCYSTYHPGSRLSRCTVWMGGGWYVDRKGGMKVQMRRVHPERLQRGL